VKFTFLKDCLFLLKVFQFATMYESKNLDHLGLVSGMCDELGLVELMDRLVPSWSDERKISTSLCVKVLIMNGLDFVCRRLYLVSNFFSDKPTEHLLGSGITADMLNDDRLGRCLDDLYAFGLMGLFSAISSQAYTVLGL
jgi:transposase